MQQIFVRDREFYKTVVRLAVPVVLQSIITIGVNIVGTMMLGKYGEVQLSASSLANEFLNIFQILCMGMGCGAAVLTAQYWGRGDVDSFKCVVAIMLRISMVFVTLFTVATLFFPGMIMGIYTKDAAVIEKGILYFKISVPTYFLMNISLTLTVILRSMRNMKVSLIAAIAAFFVNIFLSWVFIYGNLGAPEMQIAGSALAILISRVVEAAIIGGYFFFSDKKIAFRIKDIFRLKCKLHFKSFYTYSAPVILSDLLLSLGNNAVAIVVGHISTTFVAANAIIAMVVRMTTVFNQGISNASSIITGNTLGSKDSEKVYRQGITFFAISVILGILAAVVLLLISPSVIASYKNIAQETKDIAMQLMYAVSLMMIFQTIQGVLTKGVLRGGGDTKFLVFADVVFLWCASVPLGYLAGLVWGLGAFWIYVALKIDWAIKSVICTVRLFNRKWIKAAQ